MNRGEHFKTKLGPMLTVSFSFLSEHHWAPLAPRPLELLRPHENEASLWLSDSEAVGGVGNKC